MAKKTKGKQNIVYDAFDLIAFAWDKRLILIIVAVVTFVTTSIISLQINDRFKSQVTLFPAASVSISKNLVETSTISMDSRDIMSFGKDEEAERMLQILHSNQIKDFIVEKYDLMKHYKIDMNPKKFPYTKLDKKYKSNINFRRTEFMSIEITVLDEDKDTAALIANDIAAYIDSTIHNMKKERALEAFYIVEREYRTLQKDIEILNDSIQKIREMGIIDYQSQASALNQAYAEALSKGQTAAARSIDQKLDLLAQYGGEYVSLSQQLESQIERLGQLKDKYSAAKVNVEQSIPQVFIVDKATASERKAVPKRSIIVMITTISVFAFTLLLLLIIQNIKSRPED